jgi:hypothetical protein
MTADGERGRDLGDKRNALSLGTAIRYGMAAGMATQRAHRAFLAHRRAKQKGLLLPAPAAEPAECTNEFATTPRHPPADPLAALRGRISRLLDGTASHDLAAASQAVQIPGNAALAGPAPAAAPSALAA